jgi:hypothetical protein
VIGVYVIRDVYTRNAVSHHEQGERFDLWMVWDDLDERDQLIALLKGKPYPPNRTGSR